MKALEDILETCRTFKQKIEELQSSLIEERGRTSFTSGPGGTRFCDSINQALAALVELNHVIVSHQNGKPNEGIALLPYKVLCQLMHIGWQSCGAAGNAVCTLESAALSTGTWISPYPADVAAARTCLIAHRLFHNLASECIKLLRSGLRGNWEPCPPALTAQSMNRLARDGFSDQLNRLAENISWVHQAGISMATAAGDHCIASSSVDGFGGTSDGSSAPSGRSSGSKGSNEESGGGGGANSEKHVKEVKKGGLRSLSLNLQGVISGTSDHSHAHGFGYLLNSLQGNLQGNQGQDKAANTTEKNDG